MRDQAKVRVEIDLANGRLRQIRVNAPVGTIERAVDMAVRMGQKLAPRDPPPQSREEKEARKDEE